jgi:TonB-dependent receptor
VDTQARRGSETVPVVIERKSADPLPAVNLTWGLSERMNLRAGYSRTLNRPELREYVPLKIYNFDVGYLETGDSNLVQAEIESYDLRWEFYPAPRQLLSASFFYKDLTRPIERFVSPDVANYQLKPINGTRGYLRGWEVELRSSLRGLWSLTRLQSPPASLADETLGDRISAVFNYSHVHSQADTPVSVGSAITRTRPLTGQAEYSLNAGLFYAGRRLDGSLLYKDFGPRLFSLGLGEVLPDIYEQPPGELDLALGWRFAAGFRVKAAVSNLLDRPVEFTQGETVVRRYRVGRKFSLGLSWAL